MKRLLFLLALALLLAVLVVLAVLVFIDGVPLASAQECDITGFSGPYQKAFTRTTYLVWWEDYPFGLQPGSLPGSVTFQRSTPEGVTVRHSGISFRGYACDGEVAWWTQDADLNKYPCGSWQRYNPKVGPYEVKLNPGVGSNLSQKLGCNLFEAIMFRNYTPPKMLDLDPYPPPYPYP